MCTPRWLEPATLGCIASMPRTKACMRLRTKPERRGGGYGQVMYTCRRGIGGWRGAPAMVYGESLLILARISLAIWIAVACFFKTVKMSTEFPYANKRKYNLLNLWF